MNTLINKISSYNIFNCLLPGAIFSIFLEEITPYKILHNDLVINIFLIYFTGLVISRIGSLIIEPIFKIFINFSNYEDYIKAVEKDEKIEILSESNNTYRTFIALFVVLLISKIYDYCFSNHYIGIYLLGGLLFCLFTFSYVKQVKYINKRVKK